ncbi:MAG: flagellar biosynthesis protein FlhF [Phycisphaeraceae bacterium]|nr:flagellar biosynthesis protein FlhF [Phycisphaeraceae bacterium]
MILKTYRSNTMAGALAEVKRDLGSDAVILHTRSYRVGGFAGIGAKSIVEITASPDAAVPTRRPKPSARMTAAVDRPANKAAPAPDVPPPPSDGHNGSEFRSTYHPVPGRSASTVEVKVPGPRADSVPGNSGRPSATGLAVRAPLAPVDAAASLALQEELAAIRRLVGQVIHNSHRCGTALAASPGVPEPLLGIYLALIEHEVRPEIADAVIERVRSQGALEDPSLARRAALREIARRIPVAGGLDIAAPTEDGRPRTIALIGPTGVGKTTTLAKLAAAAKLRRGARVGLVTCDTYRIAAVEQLRTYANIIGLPVKVVMSPSDMPDALESLRDRDVILIDTPGRSQHDAGRLDELRALVDAARPHETHLVISCTADQPVIDRVAAKFGALSPTDLIVSKVDEGVHFGCVLNIATRLGVRLSYVTTGQEVPDHIEPADADGLAKLVVGEARTLGLGA